MAQIDFSFKGIITEIQCNINDKFKDIINNYISKTGNNIDNVYYLYSGQKIENYELTFKDISNDIDKERKIMNIQIINGGHINDNNIKIKSNQIICPKCGEDIRIKYNEYKIKLYECKNGHNINDILFNDFEKTQYIDESKIICNECKDNNLNKSYNKIFYRCNKCKMNICPICKIKHNGHNIINYNDKNYICEIHNELYTSYCDTCKKDMCTICEKQHNNQSTNLIFRFFNSHDIISYGKIITEEEEIKNKIKELKEMINIFIDNIDEIIYKLKYIKENIKIYYEINEDIINNYNIKNKNYRILQNINEIKNNNIINEIKEINNDNKNKLEKLMSIYNKMNYKNEINIIYKINAEEKTKIFGKKFVENNKDNCKIMYDNEEYELNEELEIKNKNESKLNIILQNIIKITDMEDMFNGCLSLLSIPDISKWNTNNVTNMQGIFSGCSTLSSLPDISKWNTNNVTNMSSMFDECSSLSSIPDISKWNTSNVTNMGYMFCKCSSLSSLPDISKWNTNNATNMKGIFCGCSSLSSLPDISKWNTNNVTNMEWMFSGCSSLTSLPDISKWNTNNVKCMLLMFDGCSKYLIIPNKFRK